MRANILHFFNKKKFEILTLIATFLLGLGYSLCLGFAASYYLGAGHGSELPIRLISAPFGAGVLMWPIVLPLLLFHKRSFWASWIGAGLLIVYLASVMLILIFSKHEYEYFTNVYDIIFICVGLFFHWGLCCWLLFLFIKSPKRLESDITREA